MDSKDLLDAVREGDIAKVKKLLNSGTNPNVKDGDGYTPLHQVALSACSWWQLSPDPEEFIDALVTHGAKVNVRDKYGRTPLWYACDKVARSRSFERLKLQAQIVEEGLRKRGGKSRSSITPARIMHAIMRGIRFLLLRLFRF